MDPTTVRQRILTAWEAAWDRGELEALDDITTDGFRRRTRGSGETQLSLRELKDAIRATRAGFPDLSTTVDHLLVEGDRVAIFWHSEGTHEHEMFGVPPTRKRVRTYGCNLCVLDDGRIATEEVTWDPRQLLQALGITALGDAL